MTTPEDSRLLTPPGATESLITPKRKFLISFDIDGTLEFGDPPGGITVEMVRKAKELGFLVGSCSDRFPSAQRALWEKHGIEYDFVSAKHMLDSVKANLEAERYLHIGDRETDREVAGRAGFDFLWDHEALKEPWYAWRERHNNGHSHED